MAWGSNITSLDRWNLPEVEDRSGFLFDAGTAKRQEQEKKSATTSVAEARKAAREKYMSDVDSRGKQKFNESYEVLKQELKSIDDEIKKIDTQLQLASKESSQQKMVGYKPSSSNTMQGFRPAIPKEVISSPLQTTSERPLFGGN